VTDSLGNPVTDLVASQFHLFQDGEEQVIKSCASDDVPVSIGLVLDTSGSMGDKVGLLKTSAIQFVRAANPSDEYFLVRFRNHPQVVLPFTADTDQLLQSIDRMKAGGNTALFDAVHLAVNEMRYASYPRKALLIISDGMDNYSRHTERETRRRISEIDFPIYTINVLERQQRNRYASHRRDPDVLETISSPTRAGTIECAI
jgi:Ca-activated chloride channel family protein